MPNGFRWKLCNYVGGNTAVKPSYKPYTVYTTTDFASGEITVQPRSLSDITISGLNFRPSVVFFVCFRPKFANFQDDANFGNRGGGMTFGVAGNSENGPEWENDENYSTGDIVRHEGAVYIANNANLNSEPPSGNWDLTGIAQFSGSSRYQQGFDINIGTTSWREDRCISVLWNNNGTGSGTGFPAFQASMATFSADGFTLDVDVNLYDQTDNIMWLAMGGNFQVGFMESGDTEISTYVGTPRTAVFFSMKQVAGATYRTDRWDNMLGMASPEGNFGLWSGAKPVAWNFTTERWHDADCFLMCAAASTSNFVGASVEQVGRVTDWHPGGVDIQWSVFDNIPYRIGYVLCDEGSTGYLETNWNLRPEAVGENFEPTAVSPKVILMTGTNYTFNQSSSNPLVNPRSPNAFQFGGGFRLGWHLYPYDEFVTDARGFSTYANSRQEIGHYSNSATQAQRNCLSAGAGTNSNPPAAHQHGVNVIPSPVIVGINYRYAERHGHVKRIHVNPSDV